MDKPEKPKHVHEFEDVKEQVRADNPKFNRDKQFFFVYRVCKKCNTKIIKDYRAES